MSKKIKTAVFVSGNGSNLQALIDSQIHKNFSINLVVSSSQEAYAIQRAKKANIDVKIITKSKYKILEDYEKEMLEILEKYNIQLIVLAGFMNILSEKFIEKYKNRIINIHPSLIPSFCGKDFYGIKVHEKVLEKGVKITGATTHFVNEIPDGGQILMQKAVKVKKNDTPEKLQKRVLENAEHKILPLTVEKVAKNLLVQN